MGGGVFGLGRRAEQVANLHPPAGEASRAAAVAALLEERVRVEEAVWQIDAALSAVVGLERGPLVGQLVDGLLAVRSALRPSRSVPVVPGRS